MTDSEKFFNGYILCVVQTKIGKTRRNLFEKNITKFGGSVVDDYKDDSITHFIVDEELDYEKLKRITKLEVINKPILKSTWLSECIKKKTLESIFPYQLTKNIPHDYDSDKDEKDKQTEDFKIIKRKNEESNSKIKKDVEKPSTSTNVSEENSLCLLLIIFFF